MKPTTKVAIAGLLSAAGAVLNALATEFGGADSPQRTDTPEPGTPAEAPKKTRSKAAAPAAEKPADPAPETPAEEPAAETEGKTYEDLKALIKPLVESGEGLQVKAIIKKYDPESNPPSLKTMPARNHAAFEKDIQALTY